MARTTMPFVDPIRVRGTLGKAVVFSIWKGVPYVRSYAKPANPRTSKQTSNRSQFKDAVSLWHSTLLTALDKKAWELRALLNSKILSGFNNFISVIRGLTLGTTPVLVYNLKMEASGVNVKPKITCDQTGNCTLSIIRGPDAGYSQTLAVTANVEKSFADVLYKYEDILVFKAVAGANKGESGFFRAVIGAF